MRDENIPKEQLLDALQGLRRRLDELEYDERELAISGPKLSMVQKYAQDIINSSLDMIIAVNKDRKIIEFNKAAEDIFGYTRDEIIGKHIDILYSDPVEGENISQAIKMTGKFYGEVLNRRKSGEIFLCLMSSSVLYDEEGNFIGIMGISRDITKQKRIEDELNSYRAHLEELVRERTAELTKANSKLKLENTRRKQVEKELTEEKERLAVTLRSIADGVIATDIEGRIVLINEAAKILTGWKEDVAGMHLDEVLYILDNGHNQIRIYPLDMVPQTKGDITLDDAILVAKDKTERHIAISIASIHNEDNIIGVVLVFRDITEKRKMEKEMLKIQKLESVGVLAGGIAHDFNNFLTAIIGNISIAKTQIDQNDEAFESICGAEKASLRARDLTKQLLTFSKGGSPVLKPSSIVDLVKDTTDFALRGSNVNYEFLIPDDIWNVKVDEGQISQVINNIVINAKQAMPDGGKISLILENAIIETEEIPSLEGDYVKISIEDHGIGIPEENIHEIFDPYFTTKATGNGLGLATSYSIIRSHNGYISVESKLGKGTTFFIYLPAIRENVAIANSITETQVSSCSGNVLVMDDEELIREVTLKMLSGIGYKVAVARDGNEAIEIYKEAKASGCPFDIVLLDLTVPGGMGGKEAVQKIMEIDQNVKAIASSGYSNDPVIFNFRKYGFCDALAKPYGIKDLYEVLSKIL